MLSLSTKLTPCSSKQPLDSAGARKMFKTFMCEAEHGDGISVRKHPGRRRAWELVPAVTAAPAPGLAQDSGCSPWAREAGCAAEVTQAVFGKKGSALCLSLCICPFNACWAGGSDDFGRQTLPASLPHLHGKALWYLIGLKPAGLQWDII